MIGFKRVINNPSDIRFAEMQYTIPTNFIDELEFSIVHPLTTSVKGFAKDEPLQVCRMDNLFYARGPIPKHFSGSICWAKYSYVAVIPTDQYIIEYLLHQPEYRLNITMLSNLVVASNHDEILEDDFILSINDKKVFDNSINEKDAFSLTLGYVPDILLEEDPKRNVNIPLNKLLLPKSFKVKMLRSGVEVEVEVKGKPALCSLRYETNIVADLFVVSTGLSPLFNPEVVETIANRFNCKKFYYIAACYQYTIYPGAGSQLLYIDNVDDIDGAHKVLCLYPNGEQLILTIT
jgi:hypothetical protein